MPRSSLVALLLVGVLLLGAPRPAAQDRARDAVAQAGIVEGERFPSLRLPLLRTGAPASLEDYRGERVVLHVFASW